MDISLNCKFSLSKKLRSALGQSEGRVVIVIDPVRNGVGEGNILVSGENIDRILLESLIQKETSIQFTPLGFKDEIPSDSAVSNIFSTVNHSNISKERTPVDRVAAVSPPDSKADISHAIKTEDEIETPDTFEIYDNDSFKDFVSSYDQLLEAVKKAWGKESDVDLNSIKDPRKRALAQEMKEQFESIDTPAYIVNHSCSSVTLNDIDINLSSNMPFNLGSISAKRVASSNDLKTMLDAKMIKFISPEEVEQYQLKSSSGATSMGLEIYDREGASSNVPDEHASQPYDNASDREYTPMEISFEDSPSEQEELAGLLDLTPKNVNSGDGVRKSFHGNR